MKKYAAIAATLALGLALTACSSKEDSLVRDYELYKQTGTLTDYSDMVTLGAYSGLTATVSAVEITDDYVQSTIDETLNLYNIMNSSTEDSELEWGDEAAEILSGGDYTKADKYKEYVKENLEAEAAEDQKSDYIDALWDIIIENSTFTIDEAEIEEQAESYYETQKEIYTNYASYYDLDYEEYMEEKQGMTDEEFRTACSGYVLREKQRIIGSSAIFYAQGMKLTDDDFSKAVAELLTQYTGYSSAEEFINKYGEEYVREVVAAGMVDEYLASANTMVVQ